MTNNQYAKELEHLIKILDQYNITRNDLISLILGIKHDQQSLAIPQALHFRLLELYCNSSGLIQDQIHRLRLGSRKKLSNHINLTSSRFSLTGGEFTEIIHQVADNGYTILPFSLKREETESILKKSQGLASYNCLTTEGLRFNQTNRQDIFSGSNDLVAAYADETEILNDSEIQSIIFDPLLIFIFSFLLGAPAVLRHVSLWHSFPCTEPNSEAAQLFHFDLDEFKWYKLFIFLTDVDDQSGPHVYIPGTHKAGSKPLDLLKNGYTRISDELMSSYHPQSSWKAINCKQGSMVIANTSCWHKGTPVISKTRSVLQPEYSLSTFSKSQV